MTFEKLAELGLVADEIDEFPTRSHYHFRISLRVRNSHIDPVRITEEFGIEPKRSWKAGERRQTPAGTFLSGSNQHSYWTAEMAAGRWPSDIDAAIHDTLKGLVRHRSFLHHIRVEGGSVELFVGWFFENQSGDVLTHQCLALAGDLQIDLSFDIYPREQPQNEYEVGGAS